MKNQYVGDINDYFKYAFLRSVLDHATSQLVVCWMATADDGGRDGRRRRYLDQPERFRAADPPLFDEMRRLCGDPRPSIAAVEAAPILPDALFFARILDDSKTSRGDYFSGLWSMAPAGSIMFFDPDNGLEVKSTPKGRKGSSKYLYLDEFEEATRDARSAIVYQHFGRVKRPAYLAAQLNRLHEAAPNHELFALAGTHIAFLVAATRVQFGALREAADALCARWPGLQPVEVGSPAAVGVD